jgi:hypothetical protein
VEVSPSFTDATNNNNTNNGLLSSNPWDLGVLEPVLNQDLLGSDLLQSSGAKPKKSVESILGEHSNLVNLDNLVQGKTAAPAAKNPFADQPNPFQAAAAPKPSMNQLRTGGQVESGGGAAWPSNPQQQNTSPDFNPFF